MAEVLGIVLSIMIIAHSPAVQAHVVPNTSTSGFIISEATMHRCEKCGREFVLAAALWGHQSHCGKDHKIECKICGRRISKWGMNEHIEAHKNDSPCLCCGKQVMGKKIFCDRSCSASYNNRGVRRHGQASLLCLNCKKVTTSWAFKYCSSRCKANFEWVNRVKAVRASNSVEGILKTPQAIKKFLAEVHGYSCQICDLKEWMDLPISLILDHVDGNSDNMKLNNLRLICPNCDSQLPTFKGRNKGHGRKGRRDIYRAGKAALSIARNNASVA